MERGLIGTNEEIIANIVGFYSGMFSILVTQMHHDQLLDGKGFAAMLREGGPDLEIPNFRLLKHGLADEIDKRIDRLEATGEKPNLTVVSNDE